MFKLKDIRQDFEGFKNKIKKRNLVIDFENLKKLDLLNRELIQKKENFEQEKKVISKSKDTKLFEKSKQISKEKNKISEEQNEIKIKLEKILSVIPNIPHNDVPNGKDENDNIEISKYGKILI